jgi:transcriptional regulator with XRE-family HTH domain
MENLMTRTRRELTQDEEADTARLSKLWQTKAPELMVNQKTASEEFGFKNQSAVSQYLRGRIPLNMNIAAKFAQYLQVPLADISPRFAMATNNVCDINGEIGFLHRMNQALELTESSVLIETTDQNVTMLGEAGWYVVDTSQTKINEGTYAFVDPDSNDYKLAKFKHLRGSFKVIGLTEGSDEVLSQKIVQLMQPVGKVLYKISRV